MKCPMCNGSGKCYEQKIRYQEIETNRTDFTIAQCHKCNGTGEVPMTNEECIHKCTRENLAVMLVTIALYPMDFEPYKRYMKVCHDGATEKDFVDITKKWLKEKHNG